MSSGSLDGWCGVVSNPWRWVEVAAAGEAERAFWSSCLPGVLEHVEGLQDISSA